MRIVGNSMKILVLSWEFPPYIEGGLGEHVRGLVSALIEDISDLELHLITPDFNGLASHESSGRLHVHRVPVNRPAQDSIYTDVLKANTAFYATAVQLVNSGSVFDVIHVHDWLAGFAAIDMQTMLSVPLVATIHATERGRYRGLLNSELSFAIDATEARLARTAQQVIVCSPAMQHEVQHFFGVPTERLHVIPNGIDSQRLQILRHEELSAFRARFAHPDERLVFNVGRLVYEKGADLLVQSATQVLMRVPNTRFVIGGRGPLLDPLRQRVAEMGLQERVLLPGYLSDDVRDRLYVVADVCAFPSRYEPFGIVALEAMAAGTPVIVSDVGGLGEVVRHEETGLTVYAGDANSLAWAVTRVLEDQPAAAVRAERALAEVESVWNWQIIARSTADVYRESASAWLITEALADSLTGSH